MKGLSFERIVNQNENKNIKHIQCQICLLLPIDPEMCDECGETYCSTCISTYSKLNCPKCQKNYVKALPQKSLVGILQDLIVSCKFKSQGCNENVSYSNMLHHEKECVFRDVKCEGCDQLFAFKIFKQHEFTCKSLHYLCEDCGFSCRRNENKSHSCFRFFEYIFIEKIKILISQQISIYKSENDRKFNEMRTYIDSLKNLVNHMDNDLKVFKFNIYNKLKDIDDFLLNLNMNQIQFNNELNNIKKGLNFNNLDQLNLNNYQESVISGSKLTDKDNKRNSFSLDEIPMTSHCINDENEDLNKNNNSNNFDNLDEISLKSKSHNKRKNKDSNADNQIINSTKNLDNIISDEKNQNSLNCKHTFIYPNDMKSDDEVNKIPISPSYDHNRNLNNGVNLSFSLDKIPIENTDTDFNKSERDIYFKTVEDEEKEKTKKIVKNEDRTGSSSKLKTQLSRRDSILGMSFMPEIEEIDDSIWLDQILNLGNEKKINFPTNEAMKCLSHIYHSVEGNLVHGYFISGHDAGTIILWDVETMKASIILKEHTKSVSDIKYIPKSSGLFLSSSSDCCIKLWSLKSNKSLKTLKNVFPILCLETLVDYNKFYIASGGSDKNLIIWNIKTLQKVNCREIEIRQDIDKLVHIPKYNLNLIICVNYNTIRIINFETLREEKQFKGHSTWITHVIYLKGDKFASSSQDNTIKIWSISQEKCVQSILLANNNLGSLSNFLHFTNCFVSTYTDNTLNIYLNEGENEEFEVKKSYQLKSGINMISAIGCNKKIWVALCGKNSKNFTMMD